MFRIWGAAPKPLREILSRPDRIGNGHTRIGAMKNFVRWLRAVWRWVRLIPITRHYWWAIAVILVSVVLIGTFAWTEKAFRLGGMALQLGGVLTVAWGILRTRADFGQLAVRSQFKRWVKMFPLLHPPTITASGHIPLPGFVSKGYVYSTHGPATSQTIEGRIEHLEGIVRKLEVAQGKTHIAVLQAEQKAQEALDVRARQFSGQIDAVTKKIEVTATSGIHVSAVGVVLLFVGTIFGGAALEFHQLLTP